MHREATQKRCLLTYVILVFVSFVPSTLAGSVIVSTVPVTVNRGEETEPYLRHFYFCYRSAASTATVTAAIPARLIADKQFPISAPLPVSTIPGPALVPSMPLLSLNTEPPPRIKTRKRERKIRIGVGSKRMKHAPLFFLVSFLALFVWCGVLTSRTTRKGCKCVCVSVWLSHSWQSR